MAEDAANLLFDQVSDPDSDIYHVESLNFISQIDTSHTVETESEDTTIQNTVSYSQIRDAGFTVAELLVEEFTANEIRLAGYSGRELVAGGYPITDLRIGGYTTTQLKLKILLLLLQN